MAQIVVNGGVMRDKAKMIETASVNIQALYAEMLQEVTGTASKMKGTTVETAKEKFAGMQNSFDSMVADVKSYSSFLTQAAEFYESAENDGTQKAEGLGKPF